MQTTRTFTCLTSFVILFIGSVCLPSHLTAATEISISVTEPTGVQRTQWPVTSGIPMAQGVLSQAGNVSLHDSNGTPVPVQTEILSKWPDGSARWLLLDFMVDLQPHANIKLMLRCGSDVTPVKPDNHFRIASNEKSVEVITGPLKLLVSTDRFRLLDDVRLDANSDGRFSEEERITYSDAAGIVIRDPRGASFRADLADCKATVEQSGPIRTCLRFEGRHESKVGEMFKYILRIHAYHGQPFLKLQYTFINDFQTELMAKIDSLALVFNTSQSKNTTHWLNGEPTNKQRLEQIDDRSFELDGEKAGTKALGWMAQTSDKGGMAIGLREFWQNWPKALQHRPGEMRVALCPEFPKGRYDGKPIKEECELYYYLRNGEYAFKCGQAKTHELWAVFLSKQPDQEKLQRFFQATEQPLLAQCTPTYVRQTKAVGALATNTTSTGDAPNSYAAYNSLTNTAFTLHLADQIKYREYGMLNYGDWYNIKWDSWGNLEYDTARNWFQQYLRTSDRRYFDRADSAARHFADVDVLHATHPEIQGFAGTAGMIPGQVWPHLVGHTGGYYGKYVNGEYEGLAPLVMTGAYQVGLYDHGHTWVGGVFDHYLLTGDRRSLDVAIQISDSMAKLCPTRYTDHVRNIGWPFHLLLNAYEATGNEKHLTAATKQWNVLKENLDPEKGWVVLLAYGHCTQPSEAKRCRGNNMYMLGLTLTAVARYHRITQDPEVLKGLTAGVNQMIREAWDEDRKTFYLTSCTHSRSTFPFSSASMHSSEAIAYEAKVTGNKEHRRIVREALQTAIAGGRKVILSGDADGQTGYISGSFLFAPFALEVLNE